MENRRREDDDWGEWSCKQKGMSFDEDDSYNIHYPSAFTNKNNGRDSFIDEQFGFIERKGIGTLSFDSDTDSISSGNDDVNLRMNQSLEFLPDFLFQPSIGINYESRPELRVAAAFKANHFSTLKHDEDWEIQGISNVNKTIRCLLLGKDVNFAGFRSFTDKKALLAKATSIKDGNAITAVIVFLQQTLRSSLFHQMLMENKEAANHYIRYLEIRSESEKLLNLYAMMGRTNDALIFRYKALLRTMDLNLLYSKLKHFYTAECLQGCGMFDSASFISSVVKSHLNTIETHEKLLAHKKMTGKELSTKSLSVLKTLAILSLEFYDDQDPNSMLSPIRLRNTHGLTDRQFAWTCLSSLSRSQNWPHIETLLIKKGWLKTEKCILLPEEVSEILHNGGAPVDLLSMFVGRIENKEKRIQFAKRFRCHKIVFDILASRKDMAGIKEYKSKLEENSKDSIYAKNLLENIR